MIVLQFSLSVSLSVFILSAFHCKYIQYYLIVHNVHTYQLQWQENTKYWREAWYLYLMVTQNMLRTHEGKLENWMEIILFVTALYLIERLKQIE